MDPADILNGRHNSASYSKSRVNIGKQLAVSAISTI
jgi:hypothetical protein